MHFMRFVMTLGLLAATCAACGGSGDDTGVRRVVQAFFAAVHARDGSRACGMLAPQAAQSLSSGGGDCAGQITRLGLGGGRITGLQVWGDRAQAVLTGDTVFLTRFPGSWKVTAAGCRRQAKGPYDCGVEA
jgi:hypothetical protein